MVQVTHLACHLTASGWSPRMRTTEENAGAGVVTVRCRNVYAKPRSVTHEPAGGGPAAGSFHDGAALVRLCETGELRGMNLRRRTV